MRLIINVALMIVLSPTLGLIVLAVFPVLAGLLAIMVRAIAKRYEDAQEQFSVITARSQENFSGIRVVKGYAIEDREIEEYKKLNADYKRKSLLLAAAEAPEWAAVGISMNTVFVIVLLMGSRELLFNGALDGKTNAAFAGLTLGAFVQFFVYLFELSWPILAIGWMTNIFQRGASSWARLQEILDAEPEIQDNAKTDHTISSVRGEIRFDHVSLKAEGRTLLNDVNLRIPVGQTIGITGRTGSGKTLMAQLVGRLLEPTGGSIQIDGRDSREIPLEVLRKNIGLVPQEPFLFSAEIKENISFGLQESTQIQHANNVDLERIKWAANVAGLAKDVEDFPDQYDTILGERGVTLSGGQRQRTALARAVARKPAILILDDSMSAVDTETEARILTELKTVLEGRTVMLIGHRVSTLRYADHIIVLEAGRILEQGSHDDLLKLGGHYAEMDRKQSLEKDISDDEVETQNDRLEV
jgi:ATP-binding cassette, subfamily B, multidrug efflux pump